jgi:hypothetical protein
MKGRLNASVDEHGLTACRMPHPTSYTARMER